MKRAYVSGPYSAPSREGVQANCERAAAVARELWRARFNVFCPHLNSMRMEACAPYQHFLDACLAEVRRSDFVVMVEGWEKSRGALAEKELAELLGLPIYLSAGAAILAENGAVP